MAAGGGEIYRTEGDVMLRVTPHGGIIVYTRSLRNRRAVLEKVSVAPLTPEELAFAECSRASVGYRRAPECWTTRNVHRCRRR